MNREFVLLAPVEPREADWVRVAAEMVGPGSVVRFAGGMRHLVDDGGDAVVTWWDSRRVETPREVVAELGALASAPAVWVDVALADDDEADLGGRSRGELVAREVARLVSGDLIERT